MQLSKQEQLAICLVVILLLTGWAVKAVRESRARPSAAVRSAQ